MTGPWPMQPINLIPFFQCSRSLRIVHSKVQPRIMNHTAVSAVMTMAVIWGRPWLLFPTLQHTFLYSMQLNHPMPHSGIPEIYLPDCVPLSPDIALASAS